MEVEPIGKTEHVEALFEHGAHSLVGVDDVARFFAVADSIAAQLDGVMARKTQG